MHEALLVGGSSEELLFFFDVPPDPLAGSIAWAEHAVSLEAASLLRQAQAPTIAADPSLAHFNLVILSSFPFRSVFMLGLNLWVFLISE